MLLKNYLVVNMNNEEFDNKIKSIFDIEHRDDIHIEHHRYIPTGKPFISITIDDGEINSFELEHLFDICKENRYVFRDIFTLNDGELVLEFDNLEVEK